MTTVEFWWIKDNWHIKQ